MITREEIIEKIIKEFEEDEIEFHYNQITRMGYIDDGFNAVMKCITNVLKEIGVVD